MSETEGPRVRDGTENHQRERERDHETEPIIPLKRPCLRVLRRVFQQIQPSARDEISHIEPEDHWGL